MKPELLACFKSYDGSPAVRWDLDPERKRLTSKNTEPWSRKTVVLNDIFAPGFNNDQLDMLFKKITPLLDAQFVVLTAHPARMHEYMVRIWELSESSYLRRPEWLHYFTWFKPWKNIWFGITVRGDQDAETVTNLTQMPSHRRFIVLEADVELVPAWMVPKCRGCNGRGWYMENPFARNPLGIVCRECPGWELPSLPIFKPTEAEARSRQGYFLRDRRELGGEIGWVVMPEPFSLSQETINSVIASQRTFDTLVYAQGMPRRLRQSPL